MSFFETNYIERTISLRTGHYCKKVRKRTSLFIPFSMQKASLTIEAALVLPLFLFFLINLISIVSILSTYSKVQANVHQVGMKIASYASIKEIAKDNLPIDIEIVPENLISVLYAKAQIEKNIGENYLKETQIKGKEKGLHYYYSQILNSQDDMVDLVVTYSLQPFIHMLGFGEFNLINRCRVRGFTGYDNTLGNDSTDGEKVVFVTDTGTVYHQDRTCTYLKLSIKNISQDALADIRNQSGGKYYLCELCGKKEENSMALFITDYGDRFHISVNCSGLKRTITEILISQVGDRGACSKCGG